MKSGGPDSHQSNELRARASWRSVWVFGHDRVVHHVSALAKLVFTNSLVPSLAYPSGFGEEFAPEAFAGSHHRPYNAGEFVGQGHSHETRRLLHPKRHNPCGERALGGAGAAQQRRRGKNEQPPYIPLAPEELALRER